MRLAPILVAVAIGLAVQASAAREYYLVGLRHIYMFDVWPDTHKLDRHAIEEEFASAVDSAQQQYDADMASIRAEETQDNGNIHQVDRDAVQQNIEQAIGEAADNRDNGFSQLYVQCDYIRLSHPELQVDQDGPYQIMGVDTSPEGDFIDVCYYKPYPTYLDPCPFDWTWGHPYPFAAFALQVQLYHTTWLSIGSPVFTAMYVGDVRVTVMAPVRASVIASRANWAGGRPPAITDEDRATLTAFRNLQRKAGLRPPLAHPGRVRIRSMSPVGQQSKYTRPPHPAVSAPAAPRSRYGHTPAKTGTGGAHPSRSKPAGNTPPRGHAGENKDGNPNKKG